MPRTELRRAARHGLGVILFYSALFTLFFSPALFGGRLLAPGDGLLYHVAFFQSGKPFWDTLLSCGFPMTADPQVMAFYPPSVILSALPGGWNLFVLSAYVMAACFTYGYVYVLTDSKFSALVSGTVYGMCGFMMAHLGHTAIIHVAAWLPLIVWSLEMLRRRGFSSRPWIAAGAVAVACCVLAGHLQIVAYVLLLSGCYALALGWKAPAGRKSFYVASSLVFVLGLGLAALQLIPTLELAGMSARSEYSFADFVSYSFPIGQSAMLIFPGVFGGLSYYGVHDYFGVWNLTELTGYVGLLPLMLARVGFASTRREGVSLFWLCAAVAALLLALGDQFPLAELFYRLPVLGKFRVPARHFVEMAFAVSVLAGLGAHAIARAAASRRLTLTTVAAFAATVTVMLILLLSKNSAVYPTPQGPVRLNSLPWANAAVAVPLVVLISAALALLYWQRAPASAARRALLLTVLVLDLSSFGWFYSWQEFSPHSTVLNAPPLAREYGERLRATGQRALPVRGTRGEWGEVPPNISRLWDVPVANGYGPLGIHRISELLGLGGDAAVGTAWKSAEDRSIDLAAARYVILPRGEPLKDGRGILWETEEMGLWLGADCDHPPLDSARLSLPSPVRATRVGLVTRLACAPPVPDGEEVLQVTVTDSGGATVSTKMLAGRDTSEWAYDCRAVKPGVKHARAEVFSSFPAEMQGERCEGHFYLAMLDLGGVRDVTGLDLRWVGRSGALTVEKVSLIDEPAGVSVPVNALARDGGRWQVRAGEGAGEVRVYENLRALPRAWLVTEVVALGPEEALRAIKSSKLPDGRAFDPARTALVEDHSAAMAPAAGPGQQQPSSARVAGLSATEMEVETDSPVPAFLVTSDTFYTGWQASVDGTGAPVLLANYAFRGVRVPAGRHTVRFQFRPKSFYYGAGVSLVSLLALGLLFLKRPGRPKSL